MARCPLWVISGITKSPSNFRFVELIMLTEIIWLFGIAAAAIALAWLISFIWIF